MRLIHFGHRLFWPAHYAVFGRPICLGHFGFGRGGGGAGLLLIGGVLIICLVLLIAGNASKGKGDK
jgi:uncharacterized membrane protein